MFLTILIIPVIISIIDGRTIRQDEPLFGDQDFCLEKCGPKKHSLCTSNYRIRSDTCGEDFFLYDILSRTSLFERQIMFGHNGIRNRIAERMKVADMIKLQWDIDLAAMATNWVSKCKPYVTDPCASFYPTSISYDRKEFYKYVNSNSVYIKSSFLPPNLIVSSLRNWYLEKNTMSRPTIIPYKQHAVIKESYFGSDLVGYFKVHNNFTQIANAATSRIGCALARNNQGYHFTCYYHPYMKQDTFLNGKPISKCPNLYPLADRDFTNLCTADGTLSIYFQDHNLIYIVIVLNFIWYLIM